HRVTSSGSDWDEDRPAPIEQGSMRKATGDGRSGPSKKAKEEMLDTLELLDDLAQDVERQSKTSDRIAKKAVNGRHLLDMSVMEELDDDVEEGDEV
ncbi:hypothetical protein FRB90_005815, partial [Tulasnella sp. 427]